MSEPKWPDGSVAGPAPEGTVWLCDPDGTIVGVQTAMRFYESAAALEADLGHKLTPRDRRRFEAAKAGVATPGVV